MLARIIVTRFFLQVITTLVRYFKRRDLIIDALVLVFISSKQFKPLLRHLHTCACAVPAIVPRFTCDNGMPDCGVSVTGTLEQIDLSRDLL